MSNQPDPDRTIQVIITPELRPMLAAVMQQAGLQFAPCPVLGTDGRLTIDPENGWPGDDLPTYALLPAKVAEELADGFETRLRGIDPCGR